MESQPSPRVLFISHSASRNGATILLVNFLVWLKNKTDWQFEVLVQGTGPMISELRSAGIKTTIWRDPSPILDVLIHRSLNNFRRIVECGVHRATLPVSRYDLIYANTSATGILVALLAKRCKNILWHVHELDYALKLTLRTDNLVESFQAATRFIAVSDAVKKNLISNFNIPSEQIDLVNGFVPVHTVSEIEGRRRRRILHEKLGWPFDAYVIGGCGSLGWRKGTDVFLQIAAKMVSAADQYENIRFLWIGGHPLEKEFLEFEHDVRMLGLEHRCRLIPATEHILDYYCAMNVFALTSREDPFPLVMLEAAQQGIPVVCFEGAGGGGEFVDEVCGITVPYLDIDCFARQLIRLHSDIDLRQQLGQAAQMKVSKLYNVEAQGPRLLKAMERCLREFSG